MGVPVEEVICPTNTDLSPSSCSPVNSHNEWDPLEEVIVGTLEGTLMPSWEPGFNGFLPAEFNEQFRKNKNKIVLKDNFTVHSGKPFPEHLVAAGQNELDNLAVVLEREGIKVRRPKPIDFSKPITTHRWTMNNGFSCSQPRDVLLIVGDLIIEAPMGLRSRYFEHCCYKDMCKEYFKQGARWISAPRPELGDDIYDMDYYPQEENVPPRYVINNNEPLFDAASITRCGKDLFVIKDSCCNSMGIEWLKRHLNGYRIHEVENVESRPLHIDTTIVPMAPGKVMINKKRVRKIPELFRSWEVFEAPEPCIPNDQPLFLSSHYLHMNILMLDENRAVVPDHEEAMIASLKKWGFEPIPIPFLYHYSLGGGIHCVTLDVRREGNLQCYF